jgi:hypothetical protein
VKNDTFASAASAPADDQGKGGDTHPPELADLLARVAALLEAGEPEKARALLARTKSESPWAKNALGVCLLRLGQPGSAVELFRGLVLPPTGLHLRADAPTVFKVNFAAALLAAGNVSGGIRALEDARAEERPAVHALRAAVERWTRSLSFWEKVRWRFGSELDRPVVFDFPLGEV